MSGALWGVADAIVFRPLPVAHSEKIVRVFTASASQRYGFSSYPDFEDLRNALQTVNAVAESQILVAVASGRGAPAQVRLGLAVTPDYFDVLGVQPALGRTFRRDELRDPVVVLAYAFWRAHPAPLGSRILLGATLFTVIGVAPENFTLDRFAQEDYYVPIGVYEAGLLPSSGKPMEDRSRRYLSVYARLHPNATMAEARAEIAAIGARLAAQHPDSNRGRRMVVTTEMDARLDADRNMAAIATLLLGMGAMVSMAACANTAVLLAMRAQTRAREIALKIALGASGRALLAENLAQGAAISSIATVIGVTLGWAAMRRVQHAATLPSDLPFAIGVRVGGRMMLAMVLAAAAATLVLGVVPSFAGRKSVSEKLKMRRGGLEALVTAEIAFACALAVLAVSLGRAISTISRMNPGYRTDHVLTLALDPAQVGYNEAHARVFYDQVLERVRSTPGVPGVALAQSAPLGFTGAQRQIEIPGEAEPSTIWINIVTPDYFDVLRIPLERGRAFDDHDTAESPPVAIVNQELARRVGSTFRLNGRTVEVIGVARTAKYLSAGEAPRPFLYLPFSQNYSSRMVLHAETSGDPASRAHAIVAAIRAIDRAQPVSEIRPAGDYLTRGATFHARLALETISMAGAGGLALALAGLYGVVAQSVIARRREIGIRMALGARPGTIVRLLVRRGARLAAIGVVAGEIGAWAAQRAIAGLVPGVRNSEAYLLGSIGVLTLSAAAALIPAVRAASADPARLLAGE